MSLTVSQLMGLPSLRRAKVLAGHKSLSRIVTGVTVLEYSTPTDMQKHLFESIDFSGSELILTGLCNIADDVDAQCDNIRRLALAGEVGMILYYVGLILPRVDARLIRLANELDFVLICMPEREPNLRYGEVIHEVMDAIVRDELADPSFALDLLEQMTKIPSSQQNGKTVLRITSDRLRASVAVTDAKHRVLSEAAWPRDRSVDWQALARSEAKHTGESAWPLGDEPNRWVYRAALQSAGQERLYLFVLSEHGRLDAPLWKQVVEGVRLSMGIWGKTQGQTDLSELVRAIVLNEPTKMRRLGDLYHIDIASMRDMWIVRSLRGEDLSPWTRALGELSALYTRVGLCEHYENDVLIFPLGSRTLREMDEWTRALTQLCAENGLTVRVTRCTLLQQAADVKYAYETNRDYLEDSVKVFPLRESFTSAEIEFVKECCEIAAQGKEAVRRCTALLDPILRGKDGADIAATLAVYLLDKNSGITQTAAQLFVHKNTVKYRLQKASDLLGFRVGDVPQSKNLIYALALRRILAVPSAEQEAQT